ncbi:MAG: selenide, water dikinase SelD [Armatimonadetes bacterium]|nr:selenide, water dikinase SelD [Armatimonadota bacterium]
MIDIEKRKKIMARSIKLGHCICNPKKGCPCDIFKEKDVCPCAGERVENAVEEVRLTSLVEKAGCASKINQSDLKKVLAGLPDVFDPNVLVGTNTCDDAGVYKLDDNTALVQTVDVFTPSVDDPYTFGQVAAANSLSDVYAMGGTPLTALSIIGFPIETISHRVMTQMLRGGMDKMREASVVIIGGHSINDHEPKFGYAVTGIVNPSKITANNTAKPGDVLVLTKPLGVGIISFAGQLGAASESALNAAAASMIELNKVPAEVMMEIDVSSATDVTGFGLLGHLGEMVSQSSVSAEIWADSIPIFDEVLDYISRGMISGGVERNIEHSSQIVTVADDVSEAITYALYDPQTSGGMLMAVPEAKANALVSLLKERGVACAEIIGRITGKSQGEIIVKKANALPLLGERAGVRAQPNVNAQPSILSSVEGCGQILTNPEDKPMSNDTDCCSGGSEASGTSAGELFSEFCGANLADGAVSLRTKELMAIALSLVTKCEPCVNIHINKAKNMGITDAEIQECVNMAIMFGGAPVMMFYNSIKS